MIGGDAARKLDALVDPPKTATKEEKKDENWIPPELDGMKLV